MADLSQRILKLSPERARLLESLKSRRAGAESPIAPLAEAPSAPGPSARPTLSFHDDGAGSMEGRTKAMHRRFYDSVTTQLDASVFGAFSYFLNYGYVADISPQHSRVELPEHYINRNSVKLVLETIGDCDVNGRRILDVGCGRGGTVHVLTTFFRQTSVTGVDLAPAAIAFCRKTHAGGRFEEADAENLPFPEESFDVVVNVESSHAYPNILAFYRQVHRVLAPGGYFLYTDVLPAQTWDACHLYFRQVDMSRERDQDITANVLLSCDQIAQTRVSAFDSGNDPELMANFLAVPGSEVYDSMLRKVWIYKILRFHKPG